MRTWLAKNDTELCALLGLMKAYLNSQHETPEWEVIMKPVERQRTNTQNNSIHLYCRMLAKDLNRAGLDIKKTLKADFDIPWSETTVKELIWKPVQKALTDKQSTSELNTQEVSQVFDTINRHMAGKGITTQFPSKEAV